MKATVEIEAGICGLRTTAEADCPDGQNVTFQIRTDCEKVRALADRLAAVGPIDAYHEIGPRSEGVLMQTVRGTLTGCCAGCVTPVGLFKAMQVAAGLALPKDVAIRMTKE
ncbi:MAG: hypothetical protein BIFFINMI_01347 [Phycisphaerae bacterium]|nr:hypothetical protein [Phycisphaerae bacterium]